LEICGKTVHLGLPMHLVVPILILAWFDMFSYPKMICQCFIISFPSFYIRIFVRSTAHGALPRFARFASFASCVPCDEIELWGSSTSRSPRGFGGFPRSFWMCLAFDCTWRYPIFPTKWGSHSEEASKPHDGLAVGFRYIIYL
jgi:hypothetical protein